MNALFDFLKASFQEAIHYTSWPTFKQLQISGVLVLVAAVVFSLVVFLMDISLRNIMQMIYHIF